METTNHLISLAGLGEGVKEFTLKVDDLFFERFDQSPIKNGDLDFNLNITNNERFTLITSKLIGTVKVPCDRCLDEFDLLIDGEFELVAKPGFAEDEAIDSEDEILYYKDEEGEIDMAPILYDYIILSLPMKKIHPVDADGNSLCNEDMIKYLEKNDNDNSESDPRWEALKNLK